MCPFKWLTGVPCPGCGMTRAFLHFFEGDIVGALTYHPLFWVVPILLVILLFRKKTYFNKLYRSSLFWQVLGIAVVGIYIIRMIRYFPTVIPMDFEAQALIPRILRFLRQ